MVIADKRKRAPKMRMPPKPAGPGGQLEGILAELQVIRRRLDYLIAQINRYESDSVQ
jgi:hypothetical protein